jgi:hypothetical protein
MKKQYVNPPLEVVKIQQLGYILTESIVDIAGNTDIDYGGGGHGEPMAPEFFDEFEVDAAYFDN